MNISQIARNQVRLSEFVSKNQGLYSSSINSGYASRNNLFSGLLNGVNRGTMRNDDIIGSFLQSINNKANVNQSWLDKAKEVKKNDKVESVSSSSSSGFNAKTIYTKISDNATKSMQQAALEFAKNSVKKKKDIDSSKADAKEEAKDEVKTEEKKSKDQLINEELKKVDPSKRTATYNTMNEVYKNEVDRIEEYIREKDKDWNGWGDDFDTSILDDYKPGVNIFI